MKTIQLKYALLGTSRSKENKENRYSRVQHVFPINTEMLTKMATITEKYFERSRSSSGSCDSVNKTEAKKINASLSAKEIVDRELNRKYREKVSLQTKLQKYIEHEKALQSTSKLPRLSMRSSNIKERKAPSRRKVIKNPTGEIDKILHRCIASQKVLNRDKRLFIRKTKYKNNQQSK